MRYANSVPHFWACLSSNDLRSMACFACHQKKTIEHLWWINNQTRPIRPTMRPHDEKMIVWMCDNVITDRPMDYKTVLKRCDDESRGPSIPPLTIFYSKKKMMIFLVFDESVTDGPTDQPTDRQTDRPGYRDARTHLKMKSIVLIRYLRGRKTEEGISALHD